MTEDEMVGWYHRFNGHGFGWTLGVGDGQGGLMCCGSWGHKESDRTERLNLTEPHILKLSSLGTCTSLKMTKLREFSSVQSRSHNRLFVAPWTGFPVQYQLPELAQTHLHWVGAAIQPSHPLSSPYPPAFNLSQHQGLFQ